MNLNTWNVLQKFDPENVIVIDTETTGLNDEKDEVLSLAVLSGNGDVLFNDLIKPRHRKSWPKATEIHGIKWKDVKDKATLEDLEDTLRPIFDNADLIIGYNVPFDISMLQVSGAKIGWNVRKDEMTPLFDVMREYAEVHGPWSEWQGRNRWVKLSQCAKHYGYKFKAHNALEDCKATLFCFNALTEDEEYVKHISADIDRRRQEIAESQARLQKEKEQRELDERIAARHSKYSIFIKIGVAIVILVTAICIQNPLIWVPVSAIAAFIWYQAAGFVIAATTK